MFQLKFEVGTLEEYKQNRESLNYVEERLNNLKKEEKLIREGENFPSWFLFGISFFYFFLIFNKNNNERFWENLVVSAIISAYFFSLVWAIFSDFLLNIFTLGGFNRIRKQIKATEELKANTYNKLKPFEKPVCDYYQEQLRRFFESNLYNKRSGSQQFEETLFEFAGIIEEASTLNSKFVTTHIPLLEYQSYLLKRESNHNFQVSKKSEEATSIRNFVKDITKPLEQKSRIIVAPEKLYRTARKIDWEAINKKRKLTGTQGEEMAVAIEQDFFESIGRKDLADKVRHVSVEDGDGLGYDILSFFEDGREKYIEVKSSRTSLTSTFELSRNELAFLEEHNEDALIYRILVSGENSQMKALSASDILEMYEITPVRYMVRSQ